MTTLTINLAGNVVPVEMPGSVSAQAAAASAAAAAQSAIDATTNGAAQVTLAAAQVALAADQVALAEAQVALAEAEADRATDEADRAEAIADALEPGLRMDYFASAAAPLWNGEFTDASARGEYLIEGSKTAMVGSGASAWFATGATGGVMMFVDLPLEFYGGVTRIPTLLGSDGRGGLINNRFDLQWVSHDASTGVYGVGNPGKFRITMRGNGGAGSEWILWSPAVVLPGQDMMSLLPGLPAPQNRKIAAASSGRFALKLDVAADGTTAQLDFYDIDRAAWLRGTPTPRPATFAGITALTNDLRIFSAGGAAWLADNAANRVNTYQFMGAIRDVLITDTRITDADVEAILNGADVAETVGSSNIRLHCPLVDSEGRLTNTLTTNRAAMTLTRLGTIEPGPTLRKQTAAASLTIDALPWPGFISRRLHVMLGEIELFGTFTGTSGLMMAQVISMRTGRPIKAAHPVAWVDEGSGRYAAWVSIPAPCYDEFQIQTWMTSHPEIIATTHAYCMVGLAVQALGQSEVEFACGTTAALLSSVGETISMVQPRADLSTIFFSRGDTSNPTGSAMNRWFVRSCETPTNLAGGGGMHNIANQIRMVSDEPVWIIQQMVSGSDLTDLMDDDFGGVSSAPRSWQDYLLRQSFIANRGRNGEVIVAAEVIVGWEAFWGGSTPGLMKWPYQSWMTGRVPAGNPGGAYTVDHWAGDGHMSTDLVRVVMPCNRKTAPASSRDDTMMDQSEQIAEGLQRDTMRNWAHKLGFLIGPETTGALMENTNTSTGELPSNSTASTHPLALNWQGDIEMSQALAESIKMGFGLSDYVGPTFFEGDLEPGSASNKVILRLGPPRPFPGEGLSEDANGEILGHTTAYQRPPIPCPMPAPHTKVDGGNARWRFEARITASGSYSVNNVTACQIGVPGDPRAVELTLADDYVAGETEVVFDNGGVGSYSQATVDQITFCDGTLMLGGSFHEDGKPEMAGYPVAGSQQPHVLPS